MVSRLSSGSVLYIEEKTDFNGDFLRFIVRARADQNGFAVPTTKIKERYQIHSVDEMLSLRDSLDQAIARATGAPAPDETTLAPSKFRLDADVETRERPKVR